MYVTEAMIQSMEEMMRNASDMEKSIKMMMESEGRMHGMELDRRHSARDMWKQLMDHMSNASAQSSMMTEMDDPIEHHHHEDMDGLPSDVEPTQPPMEPMASAPIPGPANTQS
jgi:hypothetical protein